jgi:bifunctional DNA-binding transcriptional regulator/antitoxin component of YhaV-PrlF toxin-antitoxin module
MGYPTKVQLIKRSNSEQWYINFPSALAQAIELERGEVVEWIIDDCSRILLQRKGKAVQEFKKKLTKNK